MLFMDKNILALRLSKSQLVLDTVQPWSGKPNSNEDKPPRKREGGVADS
jgi:hypothetical protein